LCTEHVNALTSKNEVGSIQHQIHQIFFVVHTEDNVRQPGVTTTELKKRRIPIVRQNQVVALATDF
jgi:hypothetical protein